MKAWQGTVLVICVVLLLVALAIWGLVSIPPLKAPRNIDDLQLQTPYVCIGEPQNHNGTMLYIVRNENDKDDVEHLFLLAANENLPRRFIVIQRQRAPGFGRTSPREVMPYSTPPPSP
ncbi:MAG: hypothetical protein G01um101425_983 [Candidatus Peregrinibacteria bacterium Gr01-1014_25]|nr:MAG: hypothetical protein G01um101425_983 [Candidatus Peregrinibacteria bacterium Gr01-1014_25]